MTKITGNRINVKKNTQKKKRPLLLPGEYIDYKNVALLRKFISQQAKILSRQVNRLRSKQHRTMTKAIKSARILALLHFKNNET